MFRSYVLVPATVSETFGEHWCRQQRSAILLVPSVVARLDRNVLINPAHREFATIHASLHEPVYWDRRLFGSYQVREGLFGLWSAVTAPAAQAVI
jgi:hypothetical protein